MRKAILSCSGVILLGRFGNSNTEQLSVGVLLKTPQPLWDPPTAQSQFGGL